MSTASSRDHFIKGYLTSALFIVGTVGGTALFAQEVAIQPPAIKVIARGKVFSSLKEYLSSEASRALPLRSGTDSFSAVKALAAPAEGQIPVETAIPSANRPAPDRDGLRVGTDANGWKTVWVGGAGPESPSAQASAQEVSVPAAGGGKPVLPAKGPATEDAVTVARVLGVYPSMAELIKDFEKSSFAGQGGTVIPISSGDDLGERMREQAAGIEGPLLVLSGHGRVRMMGLKPNQTVGMNTVDAAAVTPPSF